MANDVDLVGGARFDCVEHRLIQLVILPAWTMSLGGQLVTSPGQGKPVNATPGFFSQALAQEAMWSGLACQPPMKKTDVLIRFDPPPGEAETSAVPSTKSLKPRGRKSVQEYCRRTDRSLPSVCDGLLQFVHCLPQLRQVVRPQ